MIESGLVVEGGGMRGVYTAGVLDFFMDKNIYFDDCYGVSAGDVCKRSGKAPSPPWGLTLTPL